jgi:replicative DNA helicase
MPGHLWIIGAYVSVGKSAWLVDFICRLYGHSDNPGIAVFSTEMSSEQYVLRMLSNRTRIPGWVISEKRCTVQQEASLIDSQVWLSKRNLYIYDKLYRIEDIEKTVRMLKPHGLDVICIDYLQNMWGDGNIYERMSRLSPILQYMAKELQITIVALSQISNQAQREKGAAGGVYGFKGAGEIAASADLAIELERSKENEELLIFKVSKNRHGRIGEGLLQYMDNFARLKEVAKEGYQDTYGG